MVEPKGEINKEGTISKKQLPGAFFIYQSGQVEMPAGQQVSGMKTTTEEKERGGSSAAFLSRLCFSIPSLALRGAQPPGGRALPGCEKQPAILNSSGIVRAGVWPPNVFNGGLL